MALLPARTQWHCCQREHNGTVAIATIAQCNKKSTERLIHRQTKRERHTQILVLIDTHTRRQTHTDSLSLFTHKKNIYSQKTDVPAERKRETNTHIYLYTQDRHTSSLSHTLSHTQIQTHTTLSLSISLSHTHTHAHAHKHTHTYQRVKAKRLFHQKCLKQFFPHIFLSHG